MKRGLLIVLEGVDKAGKTTQARLLSEYLTNVKQERSEVVAFPNRSSDSGKLISNMLKAEKALEPKASHLLFSFDRWKEKERILSTIGSGSHLILDRYAFSGVAYSLAQNVPYDWAMVPDQGLPRPDLVFQLEIDIHKVIKRDDFGREIFERENFQLQVQEKFKLFHHYHYWRLINANRTQEEILNDITREIEVTCHKYETICLSDKDKNYYPRSLGQDLFTIKDKI